MVSKAAARSPGSSIRSSSRRKPRRTAPSRPMPPSSPVGQATVNSGRRKLPPAMACAPSPYALCRITQANGTVSEAPTTNMRLTWRTRAVSSASGPTMKPGVSHRDRIGSPNASHSWRKRAALSALAASMAPARCIGLLAITPTARPSTRDRALAGRQLDRPPHVVDPPAVGRHDVTETFLLRRRPVPHVPLEVRQVPAGRLDGFLLIGAQEIYDPTLQLHRPRRAVL